MPVSSRGREVGGIMRERGTISIGGTQQKEQGESAVAGVFSAAQVF